MSTAHCICSLTRSWRPKTMRTYSSADCIVAFCSVGLQEELIQSVAITINNNRKCFQWMIHICLRNPIFGIVKEFWQPWQAHLIKSHNTQIKPKPHLLNISYNWIVINTCKILNKVSIWLNLNHVTSFYKIGIKSEILCWP